MPWRHQFLTTYVGHCVQADLIGKAAASHVSETAANPPVGGLGIDAASCANLAGEARVHVDQAKCFALRHLAQCGTADTRNWQARRSPGRNVRHFPPFMRCIASRAFGFPATVAISPASQRETRCCPTFPRRCGVCMPPWARLDAATGWPAQRSAVPRKGVSGHHAESCTGITVRRQ